MARKNNSREEGSIRFDTRTRTVMAEFRQDNLKEKLKAVREVVPGKKRDEIVMVLQYFEYNVEKTIQAYLEDGAKKVLQEWNHTQPNRKGKGRQKERPDPKANSKTKDAEAKAPAVNGGADTTTNHIDEAKSDSNLPNGHLPHDHSDSPEHTDSEIHPPPSHQSSSSTTTSSQPPQRQHNQQQRGDRGRGKGHRESHGVHHNSVKQHHQRERTMSERSNASSVYGGEHGHHSLDKSFKDLQRQTTSLERLKHLLDSEIERSSKSVKKVFEEIRKGLDERESKILAELEVVKVEADEMLNVRQSKAMDLKRMVERAERLKEAEIADVRSQIKHFVTDRRHDEELGRTTRFTYDSDHLLSEVQKFGEVIHIPKPVSRQVSTASVNSSGHNGVADIEDRLKNSLHIQDSSSQRQTTQSNGPRNKGSYDKQPRGTKSPQSRKSTATPTSPPPASASSSSATPAPTPSSPQPQRPQQQRQRRPDSRRNNNRGGSGDAANSNDKSAVDSSRSNDNSATTSDGNSSHNRGSSGGSRGQGRGKGSGRGRGGRGGYRGNQQQSSSSASNGTSNPSQPTPV